MWKTVLGRSDKSEASSSKRKDDTRSQEDARPKRKDSVKDGGKTREKRDLESVVSATTRGTNRGTDRGIDFVSNDSGYQAAQSDGIVSSRQPDSGRVSYTMDDLPRSRGTEDEKRLRRRVRSNSRERTYRRDRSRSEERVKSDKKEKKLKRRSTDTGAFMGESSRAIEDTRAGETSISNHVPDMFPGQFTSDVTAPYRPPLAIAEGGPGLASEYYNNTGGSWQQPPANPPASSATMANNRPPGRTNIAPQMSSAATGAAASYMMNTHSEQSSSYQTRPSGAPNSASVANVSVDPPRPAQQSTSSNLPYAMAAGAATGIAAGAYYNHTHEHSESEPSAMNYSNNNNYGIAQRQRSPGPLNKIVNFFKDPEGVARFEEYSEAVGICRGCFEPGSTPYQAPRRHGYKKRRSSERLRPSRVEKDNRYYSSSDEGKRKSNRSMLGAAAAGIGLGGIGRALLGDFDDTYSVKSGKPASSGSVPYRPSSKYSRDSVDIRDDDRPRKSKKVEYGVTSSGATYEERHNVSRASRNKVDTITVEHSRSRSHSRDRKRIGEVVAGAAIGAPAAGAVKRRTSADETIRVKHRSRSRSRERRSRKAESPTQSTSIFGNFFSSPSSNGKRKSNKNKSFFNFSNGSSSSDSSLAFGASDRDRRRKGKRSSPRIKTTADANAALIGLGTATAALAAYESRNRKSGKHVPAVVAVKSKGKQDHYRESRRHHAAADDGWESASEDSNTSVDSGLAFGSPFNKSRESLTASGTDKWDWRWSQKRRRSSSPRRDTATKPTSGFATAATAATAGVAGAAIGALVGETAASSYPQRDGEYSSSNVKPLQYVVPVSTSDPRRFDAARHDSVTGQVPYRSRPDSLPIQQPQPIVPVPEAVYSTSVPDPRPSTYTNDKEYRKQDIDNVVVIQPRSQRVKEENARFDAPLSRKNVTSEKTREDQRSDDRKRDSRGQDLVVKPSEPRKSNRQEGPIEVVIEPGKRKSTRENREIHHSELEDDHLAELHRELERMKAMAKPRPQEKETSAGTIVGLGMAGIATAAVAAGSSRRKASDKQAGNVGTSVNQSNKEIEAVSSKKSGGFAGLVNRITKVQEEETSGQDKKNKTEKNDIPHESLTRASTTSRIASSQGPVAHESYAAYFAPDDILSQPSKAKETNPNPNADIDLSGTGDRHGRTVQGRYGEPEYPKIENEVFDPLESHQMLPWKVPKLGLINPTPVPSRAPSAHPSPTIQPANPEPEATEAKQDARDQVAEIDAHPPDYTVIAPKKVRKETTSTVKEPVVVEKHDVSPTPAGPSAEITSPVEEIHRTSMPGGFEDDIDFAATLAAGAAAAGFNPDIVIEDPKYRRRDSPPGSQSRGFYKQPYYQTVSDIGVRNFSSNSTPQPQGFVVGEVPDTPKEEPSTIPETPGKDAKSSRKEQRKKDKTRRRAKEDATIADDIDDPNIPDTLEGERLRDSTELEIIEDMARDTQTEPDTPVSKKSKKKSKRDGTSDFASAAFAAIGGSAAAKTFDDLDFEDSKSSKKEPKKSNGFDLGSVVMAATKDTSKPKPREAEVGPEPESGNQAVKEEISKPKIREAEVSPKPDYGNQAVKEEIQNPAVAVLPSGGVYPLTSSPTATKMQSIEQEQEDEDDVETAFDSSNEYAPSTYTDATGGKNEEDGRKHRRKSRRRSKTFDDAASTTSTQYKAEDKKESGKKKSGLFGFFGKSSSNDSSEKQQPIEAQEEDLEPFEVSKKKKKSRKSREVDEVLSTASVPVSELTKVDEAEDDRKSRRRRSRKGTQGEDDSGRAAQDLPDKDDYEQPDKQSFLDERREKLRPPDVDIKYQDQNQDETDPGFRQYSGAISSMERPSTPPKIDWINDDAFTPKGNERLPNQFPMIQSSTSDSPAIPSPTSVPLIFRKPPSATSGARPSSTSSSPALTTPKSRKPRPSSIEFRANEFRPLWLVSQYGPKQEVDPEEVFPSLPSSHSNSRSSSVHEDDQKSTETSKNTFSDKSIDIAAASAASEDILDSGQITPTATTYRNKREQDLLDEARHEAVARELEWVQRSDPEAKRKSQEYPGSASTSSTRETGIDTGLAVLAGVAAAATIHNIPKSNKGQGDMFHDVNKNAAAAVSDEAGKDLTQNSASVKDTAPREQHRRIGDEITVQESLSEGPPATPSPAGTEPSRYTEKARDEILAKPNEKKIVDDGVQKIEEGPKLEFLPEHTTVAPKTDLDKSVPAVELSPNLTTGARTLTSTTDPRESALIPAQVDLLSGQDDVSINPEHETSPIRADTIGLPEGDKILPKGQPIVERGIEESPSSFSTPNSPKVKDIEHAENVASGPIADDVNTNIEHQSFVKRPVSEHPGQAESDTFERSIDSPNEGTKLSQQAWSSEPDAKEGAALGLISGAAGAAIIGDAVTAHSLNIDPPAEQETVPTDEWSSSWTSKKEKKKKKKANSTWSEQPQEAEDLALEDSLEKRQVQQALIGSSAESSKRKSVTFLDNPVSGEHYITAYGRDPSMDEAESSLVASDSNPDPVHTETVLVKSEESDREQPAVEEIVTDESPERVDSRKTALLTENEIEAETSRLPTPEPNSSPNDQPESSDHVFDHVPKHDSESGDMLFVGQSDPPRNEYSQYTEKKSKKNKGKKTKREESFFTTDKEASADPLMSQTANEKDLQDTQESLQLGENAVVTETADQPYIEADLPKSNNKKNKRLMKQQRSMAWENESIPDVIDEPTANLPENSDSTVVDNAHAISVLPAAKDIQTSQDASFETKTKKQKKNKRRSSDRDPVAESDVEMGSSSLKDETLLDESHTEHESKELPEHLEAVEDPLSRVASQGSEKQENLNIDEDQITASSGESVAATFLPTDENFTSEPVAETLVAEELEKGKKKKKGKKKSRDFSWADEPELENSARELEAGDEVIADTLETKPLPIKASAHMLDDEQSTAVHPAIDLGIDRPSYNNDLDLLHEKENQIEKEDHQVSIGEFPVPVELAQPELVTQHPSKIVDVEEEPRPAVSTQVAERNVEQLADDSKPQGYLDSTHELSADNTVLTPPNQGGDQNQQGTDPLGFDPNTSNSISRPSTDQDSNPMELDTTQTEQIPRHDKSIETQQDTATNKVASDPVATEPSATPYVIPEDDWEFTSKTSKKDKKKQKRQQSLQASTQIDKVTAGPATSETNADRDEPLATPADLSSKEPIFEVSPMTSDVIDKVAGEDYDSVNRDIPPAAKDEVWATPTKKSKRDKKGRQTRTWDSEVVESPAEDSVLAGDRTVDASEGQAAGEDTYAGNDIDLAKSQDSLQSDSKSYPQEEDSKKSRKAAKGKKKGKKVDLSMWEEEATKTETVEDELTPQATRQQEIVNQEELIGKPQHMNAATDLEEDTAHISTTPQVTTGILSSAAIALPLAIAAVEADKAIPIIDKSEYDQQHINDNDATRAETATSTSQMETLDQHLDAVPNVKVDPTTSYDENKQLQTQPSHGDINYEQVVTRASHPDAEDKPMVHSGETELPKTGENEAEVQQSKSSKKKKNKKKLFAWEPEVEDTMATSASEPSDFQAALPAIEPDKASEVATSISDEKEVEANIPQSQEAVAKTDESHSRSISDGAKDSTHVDEPTSWNEEDLLEEAETSRKISSLPTTMLVDQSQDTANMRNLASADPPDFSTRPTIVESDLQRPRSRSAEKLEDSVIAEDKHPGDDLELSGFKKTKKGKKNRRSSKWDVENDTVPQIDSIEGESNNALDAAAVASEIDQTSFVQEDKGIRNAADDVGSDTLPDTKQRTLFLGASEDPQLPTTVDNFGLTKETRAVDRQTEPEPIDNDNEAALPIHDDESTWKNEPEQEATEQPVTASNQDFTMADDDLIWSSSKKSKKGKKKRQSSAQQAEFASDQTGTESTKNLQAAETALPEEHSSTGAQLAATTTPTAGDYFADGSGSSNLYQERPFEGIADTEDRENIKEVTQQPSDREAKETAEEDDFGGWATTKKSKKGKKGKKEQKYPDEDPALSREVIREPEIERGPAKAEDSTELSQFASQDTQIKQSQDIKNILQRSSDDLQHDKNLALLQDVDQQADPVSLEESKEFPSNEVWEAPTKKKNKKSKQKAMVVAAVEQDSPRSNYENTATDREASTKNEKLDILDDREDDNNRETIQNPGIFDSISMNHPSAAAGYPPSEAEYGRSIVDEPLDAEILPEQIGPLPTTGTIDDTQDALFKTSDKTSKRKFGSEDTEAQKSAIRSQQDSTFTRTAKSATKVGTGIAIFEGIQRAASMSEDQPPKKNRKTSKEAAETLPAAFNDQERLYSGHQHDELLDIHPAFRDSALHMESPVPTSNRESVRDSGFQDAGPNTLNVSVEVDPHYDVVISSPADTHTSVDRIHPDHEIHDHETQVLSSRGQFPVEEPFPVPATMQEHSAALFRSSPVTQDEINHSQGQIVLDTISTSPIPHNKSIFGGQIGHSSDRDFNSLRSPPMTPTGFSTPHQPLMTIAEASPDDVKRLQSPSEVQHKSSRRSGTRRLKSPNPENPRQLGLISTEDIISRLSWPEFDEEEHAVDVVKNTSQSRDKDQKARSVSHIDTNQNQDRRSISGNSIESNESINAIIRSSPATVTPPLRRVDRSLSSDLRLANRRHELSPTLEENNAKLDLTKENKSQVNPEILGEGLASSSTYDPLKDKGKGRSAMMADVYEGYGDMGGSPRSPTRPNSIRRRQSMQILDLETRLDQLASENRLLLDAKNRAERNLEQGMQDSDHQNQAHRDAILTRDQYLQHKDEELVSLKQTLQSLQDEVAGLGDANRSINGNEQDDWRQHYEDLMVDHTAARERLEEQSTELEELKNKHTSLSGGMETIVANEVRLALQGKDAELEQIRSELIAAKQQVRQLQLEIMAARREGDNAADRDEDYFDTKCEELCKQVQQFVLRYSKFSDMRICRTMAEVQDEKITDRFDTSILDGTDVDVYLADRIKRRDIFMSVTMSLMWEYIFTRYLFGMDREQRQKLKYLEKTLLEVGPPVAVNKWRATTLAMLSKREAFQAQREQDTEAVVSEILRTLGAFLPPPTNLREQITDSLRKVVSFAVDLSVEMRTQKAEYIMLPPLQPEFNLQGDLETMVYFNAASMNERSGAHSDHKALEEQEAVVRIVLFPLVIKQGDGDGRTNEQEVICPAQVLIADDTPNESGAGRKNVRAVSAQGNRSVQSFAPSHMEGSMI